MYHKNVFPNVTHPITFVMTVYMFVYFRFDLATPTATNPIGNCLLYFFDYLFLVFLSLYLIEISTLKRIDN